MWMRILRWVFPVGLFVAVVLPLEGAKGAEFAERQRFRSADAHQGVAVGPSVVYAVGSRSISQHDKLTGQLLRRWEAGEQKSFIHLDSGIVKDGELFCAHSNYPLVPMNGSMEVYDADTLVWKRRHVFEQPLGSCTWIDWYDGTWWVCFAHYEGWGGYPDKDPSWTTLVRYSETWEELGRWRFPAAVLERFGRFSCSGGSWGPDGRLFATGHDRPEVYVLRAPVGEPELVLEATLPLNCFGQGIAWDRTPDVPPTLYSIKRSSREVVASGWLETEAAAKP